MTNNDDIIVQIDSDTPHARVKNQPLITNNFSFN